MSASLGLVLDDHELVAVGLQKILVDVAPDWKFDVQTSINEIDRELGPLYSLVLLDWNLAEIRGQEAIKSVRIICPNAGIVVVSGEGGFDIVRTAIECGACGFIPKASSPSTLAAALNAVAKGHVWLPNIVPKILSAITTAPADDKRLQALYPTLTERQCDVLRELVKGLTNRQIAHRLGVSDATAKVHVAAIFRALDVATRAEAVYLLARKGVALG